MELKGFFVIWSKYQLSLNWLNILFRYSVKLLLLANLVIIVVSTCYEFKDTLAQFRFLLPTLALIDLFLKVSFKKKRQDLKALYIVPNGINFLSVINILQDVFSLRNLLLPFLALTIATILEQTMPSLVDLLIISCSNTIIAGYTSKIKKIVSITIASIGISVMLYVDLPPLANHTLTALAFFLFIFYRYGEKRYADENTLNSTLSHSTDSRSNPFLWLDILVLKKSRHLQLALLKVLGICLLYCYIIFTRYATRPGEIEFDLILLIQVYFTLAPALLIPYILSSDYAYIGLLMTLPNLKSFFLTKLNVLLLSQLLLTLVLYGLNHNDVQLIFLIGSLSIFNIFFVTPIMFIGMLLTNEKVNVLEGGISSFLFIPSVAQSLYFFAVLVCSAVILYLIQTIGAGYFSWIVMGLGIIALLLRERFFKFFYAQFHNTKYRLFKILSC